MNCLQCQICSMGSSTVLKDDVPQLRGLVWTCTYQVLECSLVLLERLFAIWICVLVGFLLPHLYNSAFHLFLKYKKKIWLFLPGVMLNFRMLWTLLHPISVHVLTRFVNYYDKNHWKTITRLQPIKSVAMGSITNFYYTGRSTISDPSDTISPTC
jgi:uncharacterized membrane protein YraQ (UPF0718 family)